MATQNDDDKELKTDEESARDALAVAEGSEPVATAPEPQGELAPTQLGSRRYVHAAFFAAAILFAFLCGKILASAWNSLADWPTAVRAVPQLVTYPEEQRETFTLVLGAIIAAIGIIQIYRRETIRRWADEVADELSKVTWPNRETVVNGTIVVVVATTMATVYVMILDRFWGFLTNLVYGT